VGQFSLANFSGLLGRLRDSLRAKRQLRLDALYEFLDLIVFAVLEALLLVCRLVCHARSFPQAGRISYSADNQLHHNQRVGSPRYPATSVGKQ
jgi:hypothetical protein